MGVDQHIGDSNYLPGELAGKEQAEASPTREAMLPVMSRLSERNQEWKGRLYSQLGQGEEIARVLNVPVETQVPQGDGEPRVVTNFLVATYDGFKIIVVEDITLPNNRKLKDALTDILVEGNSSDPIDRVEDKGWKNGELFFGNIGSNGVYKLGVNGLIREGAGGESIPGAHLVESEDVSMEDVKRIMEANRQKMEESDQKAENTKQAADAALEVLG